MAKVLVVEDYPNLRQIYSTVLTKEGFKVVTAADGAEALKLAKSEPFDLILLDMLMPNVDGMQFLKGYATGKHHTAKIVAFSNMFTAQAAAAAKKLGVVRYYTKAAFDPKDLVVMVNEVLNGPDPSGTYS